VAYSDNGCKLFLHIALKGRILFSAYFSTLQELIFTLLVIGSTHVAFGGVCHGRIALLMGYFVMDIGIAGAKGNMIQRLRFFVFHLEGVESGRTTLHIPNFPFSRVVLRSPTVIGVCKRWLPNVVTSASRSSTPLRREPFCYLMRC